MAIAATATTDPHVHLLPAERTAGLMRWLHRGLPGVAIPAGHHLRRARSPTCAPRARDGW